MRLICCNTLELKTFPHSPPTYAILSHTWENDELTYQEMIALSDQIAAKAGFYKIQRAAELARARHYEWLWVDTVCIDKTSSAELTEAINSMYNWYAEADMCLVYFSDIYISFHDVQTDLSPDAYQCQIAMFESCRWLTRGWTLQELIAPKRVLFFGAKFDYLGDKRSFTQALSEVSGIRRDVLLSCDASRASIAERMSWAAGRTTTKEEDMAYCLMGIFDINMPLLYGERDRAFQRLQEEILKSSDDHSIFAWQSRLTSNSTYRGLLARSPEEFPRWQKYESIPWQPGNAFDDHPTVVTNKGIQVTLPLIPCIEFVKAGQDSGIPSTELLTDITRYEDGAHFIAVLNCGIGMCVVLARVPGKEQYARVDSEQLFARSLWLNLEAYERRPIFIRQRTRVSKSFRSPRMHAFHISYRSFIQGLEHYIVLKNMHRTLDFDQTKGFNSFEMDSLAGPDATSKVLEFSLGTYAYDSDNDDMEDYNSQEGPQSCHRLGIMAVKLHWCSRTGAYHSTIQYTPLAATRDTQSQTVHHDDARTMSKIDPEDGVSKSHLQADLGIDNPLQIKVEMHTEIEADRPVIVAQIVQAIL